MGPLIGLDFISPELDFVLALFIGIGFGFVLEQAGFSSSKRLAGLFYGTDFVVLRVFFTAAVTTMIGIVFLEYFGLLDAGLIFINPTYVWPAIVGGIVMGLGFIMGGFCPGTSFCAASIGKIDALVFVAGLLAGVFVFTEAFPLYQEFYASSYLGNLLVYDSLSISRGLFAFLLIFMAVFAFVVTYFIEQAITKKKITWANFHIKDYKFHVLAIVSVLFVGLIILFMPTHNEKMLARAEAALMDEKENPHAYISSEELAFRLLDKDKNLVVFDLRTADAYKELSLPGAINISRDEIMGRDWTAYLNNDQLLKVFIDQEEKDAQRAVALARVLGYKNTLALKGGFPEFEASIYNFDSLRQDVRPAAFGFYLKAGKELKQMANAKPKPKVKPKALKRVKGGC
jgi:uncharacterized protein